MYIEIEELRTHVREEELQEIIRSDETIALAALDAAKEFAKSKLMKHYDTQAIFSKKNTDRSPLLVKFIKDIAIWEIIGLATPHIDYNDKKLRYDDAVAWLTAVYKGMPADFPKKEETVSSSSFNLISNKKRQNRY